MRVLQLIDSLDAGGAERVAVNYANGLTNHIDQSYLCSTRKEGVLKDTIDKKVNYLFLNRKQRIDIAALLRLKRFIKQEHISIIHAHSTSIYTAVLVKLIGAKVKIVWHDHYGKSEYLNERPKLTLKGCSYLISYVFAVNQKLADWSKSVLHVKASQYLPNFVSYQKQELQTALKGIPNKRIVCLANLRPQKDHINLLKAFKSLQNDFPYYTLHLVGKDFNDDYSEAIKDFILKNHLSDHVFVYGSRNDTFAILEQCDIGVLSSKSEGLPLVLLEYGLKGLPVVCTNVGDCSKVIDHDSNGLLVSAENSKKLEKALSDLITNQSKSDSFGENLRKTVSENFSEKAILKNVVNRYKIL